MYVQQVLSFHHRQEMIFPFLQDVVRFLETHLPHRASHLDFKAKVIVTELLTNSIKHSADGQTDITLTLTNNTFSIVKTDKGLPFSAGATTMQWPSALPVGSITKIYADSLNGLFAKLTSAHSLEFYAEDYDGEHDLLADISEHYGLMIICRACHNFSYHYNPTNGVNTFTAAIIL